MIAFHCCGLALIITLQVPPPDLAGHPSAELRKQWHAVHASEATQLERLAKRLESQGDSPSSSAVLERVKPRSKRAEESTSRFVLLPKVESARTAGLANVAAKAGKKSEAWRDELRKVEEATAEALFKLAERAIETPSKHYSLADACLREVIRRQPDHPEARRLLGYVPHNGGWATPYARKQLENGLVDHPTFGWVKASWVPHLDRGELPAPPTPGRKEPRWLPADEADQLRSQWKTAWNISTEHFEIKTDVPLSEAIAFGRQLEAFHDLFFALFADLVEIDNRLPLAQRFRDKKMVGEKQTAPHQIYYFKDEQEYVDYLQPLEPTIKGTLGIYIPPRRGKRRAPAYFYRDPNAQIDLTSTLFHEVSHQLLFESAGPNGYGKNVGNYWVFEGLGTYFETVEFKPGGVLEVGGLIGPRVAEAQAKLKNGEFLPIEQLVRLGEAGYKAQDAIYLHYAESMALAIFLMQGRDGAYRDDFLDYARDAYRGRLRRTTGQSLESRLGVPYQELDKQFHEFLSGAGPATRELKPGKAEPAG